VSVVVQRPSATGLAEHKDAVVTHYYTLRHPSITYGSGGAQGAQGARLAWHGAVDDASTLLVR
jgi:hypothetical protein